MPARRAAALAATAATTTTKIRTKRGPAQSGPLSVKGASLLETDLESVIRHGQEDHVHEYKPAFDWSRDPAKRAEVLKSILAFANTDGGHVVVGVEEDATTRRPTNLKGVPDDLIRTFEKAKVSECVRNCAAPDIDVTVDLSDVDGATFVVLTVPPFDGTPRVCKNDYPKDHPGELRRHYIYIRSRGSQSRPLANTKDAQDLRDRILASAKAGASTQAWYVELVERDRRSSPMDLLRARGHSGILEVVAAASQQWSGNADRRTLEEIARSCSVNYRGWPLLPLDSPIGHLRNRSDGVEFRLDPNTVAEIFTYWRLHRSGLFYHNHLMREETGGDGAGGPASASIVGIAWFAGEATDCVGRLCNAAIERGYLRPDNQVVTTFRMYGASGRRLVFTGLHRPGWLGSDSPTCAEDEIEHVTSGPAGDWFDRRTEFAVRAAQEFYEMFNWTSYSDEAVAKLVQRLYDRSI
jgi:hypothetical protein